MTLKRHKYYRKDASKIKLTDEQYAKRIKYLFSILEGKKLPSESRDHVLLGEYKGMREFHLGGSSQESNSY